MAGVALTIKLQVAPYDVESTPQRVAHAVRQVLNEHFDVVAITVEIDSVDSGT